MSHIYLGINKTHLPEQTNNKISWVLLASSHSMSGEPVALTQLPLDDDSRPRYSHAQLNDYFTRINLPQQYTN